MYKKHQNPYFTENPYSFKGSNCIKVIIKEHPWCIRWVEPYIAGLWVEGGKLTHCLDEIDSSSPSKKMHISSPHLTKILQINYNNEFWVTSSPGPYQQVHSHMVFDPSR